MKKETSAKSLRASRVFRFMVTAAVTTLLLSATGSANGATSALPEPVNTSEVPDSLSEREKMAKSLIETVNKILVPGKKVETKKEEPTYPIVKNETTYRRHPRHRRETRSGTVIVDTDAPTLNPAPESEKRNHVNRNPRPYLGTDPIPEIEPCEDPFDALGPYLDNEEEESEEQDSSRAMFPFLSPTDLKHGEDTSGNYLWVPDSLYDQVQSLLEGRLSLKELQSKKSTDIQDPEKERVLFRGDTIAMVIREPKIGRFDRKLYNYLAYPKGMWGAALTASYGELSTDDLEMLSLLSDITVKGHIFSIKPAIYYFVRNNLAIGLRLSYTEGKAGIDSFKVDVDEDMNFALSNIGYHMESYQAGITLTQYYGLSRRSRIHLTNEVELAFASGNSDFRRPYNGVPKETHTTTMKTSLTYSPGVSVQIMKNVSFDLSFGAFGVYLRSERQTVDGVKEGTRTSSGANFRFNIFNINFGIGVHL